MPTVAVIGEVVADAVLPPDGIVDGAAYLTVHPGGGPANTAVTLARLGTRARFAGRLSQGALGQLCRARLEASGVDLAASVTASEPATLAIARLDANGSASYEFYVEGTSDWAWTDQALAPVVDGPFDTDSATPVAVHTGGLALALEPSGSVIERLLTRVRPRMTVSLDPNLRPMLVPIDDYRNAIDRWATLSDILRLSADDLDLLWPGWTPQQAAARLHARGVQLAVVSLGAGGAFASLLGVHVEVPIAPTALVDTVGAGDAFHGGLLHYLTEAGYLGNRLSALPIETLREALTFASRVSAFTCSRAGANPPWYHEIL